MLLFFFFSRPLNVSFIGVGSNTNLGGLPMQFFGQMGTGQLTFASEHMGNEISVIRYDGIAPPKK